MARHIAFLARGPIRQFRVKNIINPKKRYYVHIYKNITIYSAELAFATWLLRSVKCRLVLFSAL